MRGLAQCIQIKPVVKSCRRLQTPLNALKAKSSQLPAAAQTQIASGCCRTFLQQVGIRPAILKYLAALEQGFHRCSPASRRGHLQIERTEGHAQRRLGLCGNFQHSWHIASARCRMQAANRFLFLAGRQPWKPLEFNAHRHYQGLPPDPRQKNRPVSHGDTPPAKSVAS